MEKNYLKGSEWRKWDLHFHTPSSYDYKDNNTSNEIIIDKLIEFNISVVAITDHHYIDVNRINKLKDLAKNRLTILPGIELRSELGGSESVHFIGIFPEESDIETIWTKLQGSCNLTSSDVAAKGNDKVYVPFIETAKLIKSLGGIISIHAGVKTNSIETLKSLPVKQAIKEDLIEQIDIYEIGKVDDIQMYNEKVFPHISKRIPLIICSDNHDIKNYSTKENCWIKADPTFEGLKQIIYEPIERVAIQEIKPEEKAGYQVIDSVKIFHKDFLPQTVSLNQNLNSIIGGRSTGKSILLGCIAKKLNSLQEVKYDNDEYTNYVNEIVDKIEISWKDTTIDNNRDIEYFPQSYMYNLAKDRNGLDNLISDIIKQDPIKNNLISSYKSFCSDNNTEITNKINKLFQLNNDLRDKKNTLKEKGDKKGIEIEIERLTKELSELKDKSQISPENLSEYNSLKNSHDSLSKQLQIVTEEILKIETIKTKFFTNNDIEFELVALEDKNKEAIKASFDKLKIEFQKQWEVEISAIVRLNEVEKKIIEDSINAIIVNSIYMIGLEAFHNNTQFKSVEEKLKIQKDKLADISKIDKEVTDLKSQIDTFRKGIIEANYSYFNKMKEIKDRLSITKDKLIINATPKFKKNEFQDILNWSINQKSNSNYLLVTENIKTNEDFFKKIEYLFEKLIDNDITLKGGYNNKGLTQDLLTKNFFSISYEITYDNDSFSKMSEGKKAFVILMLLLDFSTKDCPILIDQPEDDLDNRAIYRELVTYLKKKKKERQIIVVTHNPNIVVSADSELVIIANQHGTGTPNEDNKKFQYLSGSLEFTKEPDKPREKDDTSPILEYQGIREHVCEILEGGTDAFKKREEKYHLK